MKWGGGGAAAGGARAAETPPHEMGRWRRSRRRGQSSRKLLPMQWGGGGVAAGGALDCRRLDEGKAPSSNRLGSGRCYLGCLRPDLPAARNPPNRPRHIPIGLFPYARSFNRRTAELEPGKRSLIGV